MTDVGQQIRMMIEDAMLSAYIISPRFDDYEIAAVEIPAAGIEQAINDAIKKIVQDTARKEKETQYDSHIKAYGKFKRQEDDAKFSDISSQLTDIKQLTTNPSGFILSMIMPLVPILGPMMVAASMPMIIDTIIEVLTRPGFPLDPRFKRRLDEEFNSQLDRQTQFNSSIGARNVVIQTKAGWINMQGAGHRSAMKDVREGTGRGVRQGFIGIEDKSVGLR